MATLTSTQLASLRNALERTQDVPAITYQKQAANDAAQAVEDKLETTMGSLRAAISTAALNTFTTAQEDLIIAHGCAVFGKALGGA